MVPVKLSQYYTFEKRLYTKNDQLRYLFHIITLYGLHERNKNKLYGNSTAHPVYVLIEIAKRKKNAACQNVFSMINPIKRFE